ncbi:MAG: SPOR domain-containing protein [Bryobacteraceae bacterium]
MRNNETGEFELVLGNRQLLSGFFVVVILFAVFFVMGYIVGRNTAPPPRLVSAAEPPAQAPAPSETRQQPNATPVNPSQPDKTADTAPAKESPAGASPGSAQPVRETATPASQSAVPAAQEPAPGETYLQVVSVRQPEAELVARTLKDKGFPSSLSPGPNGRTTRVLVGPYADLGKLGEAKAELERLGFHPIVKK